MAKKRLAHHESFAPISRGLKDHYKYLSGEQVKLFTYFLLSAKSTGIDKGKIIGFVTDWSYELGWEVKKFYKIIHKIEAYLDLKLSQNRHSPSTIIIKKYKAMSDFYFTPTGESKGESKTPYFPSSGESKGESKVKVTTSNESNSNELTARNKYKSIKDNTYTYDFELFWNMYPRKEGKKEAFKSWKKESPIIETVLKTLEWQKKTEKWLKDNHQYVPMPTTYINQHRWEDSPMVESKKEEPVYKGNPFYKETLGIA